ncbi:MAG: hypothetical protein R3D26_20670 [Cyanobacteriota/Melainabacteria group bacterium]
MFRGGIVFNIASFVLVIIWYRPLQLPLKIEASDLWRWDGTIGRAKYVTLGSILVVFKFCLDYFVSSTFFHKSWTILEYFAPGYATATHASGNDIQFYLTMLALSLPFAWTGSVLTIRRLRAAQLAPWLLIFFYVPLLNLVFFKILSWAPSIQHDGESGELKRVEYNQEALANMAEDEVDSAIVRRAETSATTEVVKERVSAEGDYSRIVDFLVAAAAPIIPTLVLVYLSVLVFGSYGYGLFVALPFVISIAAPLIFAAREKRSMIACMAVSLTSMAIVYAALLIFAFEGIVCLLMAAPIAAVIAAGGGLLAYYIQKRHHGNRELPRLLGGFLLLVPLIMFIEVHAEPRSPLYAVTTSMQVDAPPEVVWKHVVAFSRLPEPADSELIFKAGVAYPIEAKIYGHGPGAVRHCIFSTGTFVEPITVWKEPELLRFSVREQALPMKEFSPYKDIHPPHMEGYLVSKKGQFFLKRTKNGGTLLSGTTWYQNHMGPPLYWRVWSDQIIHAIHRRVLAHVANLSVVNEEVGSCSTNCR